MKILKILGWLTLAIVVLIVAITGYDEYETQERKKAELSYSTTKQWQWYDEYDRIQIMHSDEMGKSILRKVNMHEKYVVYAMKDKKKET